jgi:hypothetical protein
MNIFLKAYQYETTNEKVCKCLKHDHVRSTHANLQECIIQPNKSNKGKKKEGIRCVLIIAHPKRLNTLMKIR